MKIRAVVTEFYMRTDGRTDRRNTDRWTDITKLTVALRSFANAPKNCYNNLAFF